VTVRVEEGEESSPHPVPSTITHIRRAPRRGSVIDRREETKDGIRPFVLRAAEGVGEEVEGGAACVGKNFRTGLARIMREYRGALDRKDDALYITHLFLNAQSIPAEESDAAAAVHYRCRDFR
jgi:hypothetical protein